MIRPIQAFGPVVISFFVTVGAFCRMTFLALLRIPIVMQTPAITFMQMKIIGIDSLPMVILTALFIGAETVVQAQFQFTGLAPLSYLGLVVSKGLISELVPVITAFVISSRVSTAIAAEIGAMQNSEQIDALETLSLDPYRYVITPRVIAATVMTPVLVILAELIAFLASIGTVIIAVDMPLRTFLDGLQLFFNPYDLYVGIGKTAAFGTIMALSGCFFGISAQGGAKGIGEATTKAVMVAALLILMTDFLFALIFL